MKTQSAQRFELTTAILLGLNIFLLLASYYMLKTARESLIFTQGGAEIKSYSSAGQALLLLLVVPLYSKLASRVNRLQLVLGTTLFSVVNLALFALAGMAGIKTGVLFFLWVGIYNVLIVGQFWAFANDVYDEDQGKRLFPWIGFGASAGAVAGAEFVGRLFKTWDPNQVLLLGAAILALTSGFTLAVNRMRCADCGNQKSISPQPIADNEKQSANGFQLVFGSRYLLYIALMIVVLNIVNSTGEYLLGKFVSAQANALPAAEQARFIGGFYGDYFKWVNLLGLGFQLTLAPLILRKVGVTKGLFLLPMIAAFGYISLLVLPVMGVVRWVKTVENATDYSVQNTLRQALFLHTTREEKYKAKNAIDTFFWRAGDVLQALLVLLGTQAFQLGLSGFAILNLGFVAVWLFLVLLIGREYAKVPHRADN